MECSITANYPIAAILRDILVANIGNFCDKVLPKGIIPNGNIIGILRAKSENVPEW